MRYGCNTLLGPQKDLRFYLQVNCKGIFGACLIMRLRISGVFCHSSYTHNLRYRRYVLGVPIVAQQVNNLISIHGDASWIPGLTQWVKDSALLQAVV